MQFYVAFDYDPSNPTANRPTGWHNNWNSNRPVTGNHLQAPNPETATSY